MTSPFKKFREQLASDEPSAVVTENPIPAGAGCDCPNLKPMDVWMKEKILQAKTPDECPVCLVAPVVQWYYTELSERGHKDKAWKLGALVEVLDEEEPQQVLDLCSELEDIKEKVDAPLRERLKDFDCSVQAFDVEELGGEAGVDVPE